MNIEEEKGGSVSTSIKRMEIHEIIPRSPFLASLPKGVRKFCSPRCMEKEKSSPLILKFVGMVRGIIMDTVTQKPVSIGEQIELIEG